MQLENTFLRMDFSSRLVLLVRNHMSWHYFQFFIVYGTDSNCDRKLQI